MKHLAQWTQQRILRSSMGLDRCRFQVGLDGGVYLHGKERKRSSARERWKQSASALIELQTDPGSASQVLLCGV